MVHALSGCGQPKNCDMVKKIYCDMVHAPSGCGQQTVDKTHGWQYLMWVATYHHTNEQVQAQGPLLQGIWYN